MLEGIALLQHALEVALEHDKPSAALRAYFNLADALSNVDRNEEAERTVRDGLGYARRIGDRYQEMQFLSQSYALFALGKWDEALEWAAQLPEDWRVARQAYSTVASVCVTLNVHMGRLDEAGRWIDLLREFESSSDAQERAAHAAGWARLCLARDDPAQALRLSQVAVDVNEEMGITQEYVKEALVTGVEAALALRDTARAEALLSVIDAVPPGRPAQFLRAQALRFRARLAGEANDPDADRLFKRAAGLFRELVMPFYLAVTELEHAEWLALSGRSAEPLLVEAREIFDGLGASPWLERLDALGVRSIEPVVAGG